MEVRLDGGTRLVIIVGNPIAQVRSPNSLTRTLQAQGANMVVVPVQVTTADLRTFLMAAGTIGNLDAVIVTMPHKFAALGHCDATTDRARFVRAVNLISRKPDGLWIGDQLDGEGFIDGLSRSGFDVGSRRVLLAGAGGAGSSIAFEMLSRGAAAVAIHDIDIARRDDLIARLGTVFAGRVLKGGVNPAGYDLVVNATPAGMNEDDPAPFAIDRLEPHQFVADIITSPLATPLLEHARDLGCRTMHGIEMVDAQAGLFADILLGRQTLLAAGRHVVSYAPHRKAGAIRLDSNRWLQ